MSALQERLEIRVSTETMRQLRQEAQTRGRPVAALIREAIRLLLTTDREARQRAAESLCGVGAPVAEWERMEQEIVRARAGRRSRRARSFRTRTSRPRELCMSP